MDNSKQAAGNDESLRRGQTSNMDTNDASRGGGNEETQEVFGDVTTNTIVLAMVLVAWISEYAVRTYCTC